MSLLGIPIGFYGYLFPGNINLMVTHLDGEKRFSTLFLVLPLIFLLESLYCFFSLYYLQEVKSNEVLFSRIQLVSYILLLLMGLWMLKDTRTNSVKSQGNILYRGLITIFFHPQQIPFWIVVGVFFNPVESFHETLFPTLSFILCDIIGTFLAMIVYMVYGSKMVNYFKLKTHQINLGMGLVYISLATVSLVRYFV
jgi:threonine/homoserine/homoserine lactone efflux protein